VQIKQIVKIKLHVTLLVMTVIWTTAAAVESIVEQHTTDLFWFMTAVAGFLGVALIAVLQWIAISFMKDMKQELKLIRGEHGLRLHAVEMDVQALRTQYDMHMLHRTGGKTNVNDQGQ